MSVDFTEINTLSAQISGLRGQIPFAVSKAINLTVDASQTAIKASLPNEFHLRAADFITNTIYRTPGKDFATKDLLVGVVRVNPASKRDFLAKFEIGGVKAPIGDAASLAIPIVRLDGAPNLIIRRGDVLNYKKILDALNDEKLARNARKPLKGRRARGTDGAQASKTGIIGSFFLVRDPKGKPLFIIQRTGPGANHTGTRVVWAFEPKVPIPPSLNFNVNAYTAAVAAFPVAMNQAIAYAIRTMKV